MKNYFLFLFLLFISIENLAQTIYTQKDVDVCNSKFQLALDNKLSSLPIDKIIVEIGKSFLGTDYVANTLEKGDREKLVINLTGLDCYIFLESFACIRAMHQKRGRQRLKIIRLN